MEIAPTGTTGPDIREKSQVYVDALLQRDNFAALLGNHHPEVPLPFENKVEMSDAVGFIAECVRGMAEQIPASFEGQDRSATWQNLAGSVTRNLISKLAGEGSTLTITQSYPGGTVVQAIPMAGGEQHKIEHRQPPLVRERIAGRQLEDEISRQVLDALQIDMEQAMRASQVGGAYALPNQSSTNPTIERKAKFYLWVNFHLDGLKKS